MGTEIRSIQIKGRGVLVRTGGGFMYLSEFLLHYAKSECLKLGLMIIKSQSTYKTVVKNILKRIPNSENAQKDFIRRCPDNFEEQFKVLVDRVRIVEDKLQKQRKRNSIKKLARPSKTMTNDALNSSVCSNDGQRRNTLFPPTNGAGSIRQSILVTSSTSSRNSPLTRSPLKRSPTKSTASLNSSFI